ncbi:MAG: MoaD/ThiS family protein [Deltaproteobacteria bacterium]|jgi:aldehyde:ferredoxin oxidoreductase|nr:MoaD/ThiS family protein [Deltaproteobacteria bacterium]MBW2531126.1 MoaD/ThiS family protein [Deltaproteobacteria bacterium]
MIRTRVSRLLERLADEPQYPTQGATLFVDLERGSTERAYTPRAVVEAFLEGRGANMVYLYHLVDPALDPLDPNVPLILATGLLTGIVPAAARGQVSSISPESGVLLDSSCGDDLPSFMKMQGVDRLVLYGRATRWTYLRLRGGQVELCDAEPYRGLDNVALRQRVARDLSGRWGKDLAMANITRAGELGVRFAGIMGGPKALWARGGPGAKMGALQLKAIVAQGFEPWRIAGHAVSEVKHQNRKIAKQILGTGVVRHGLSLRGTPFLYRPSRLLGAIGAKNNQQTSWTAALDAVKLDPYRTAMTGCYRCPVRCRPKNDVSRGADSSSADPHGRGEGPDYVTLGKLGPMVGIETPEQVLRLNNLTNDLGLDSASLGSSIAWAMELFQRGVITEADTGGRALSWGDYPTIEQLIVQTARREELGDAIAEGARAVEAGKYPTEALDYCMAVKNLMQSDPHDARIIKAFALGLAVATRGMDHLRNRPTLEINARINDDPEFKTALYGGPVAAEPNAYRGKELAVRRCEDTFAVGDALGLCRFATKLFNSPNLPGLDELCEPIRLATGLEFEPSELERIGRNITGLERIINHRLGMRRHHDTLPRRWFDEPITVGSFAGERIDRAEFEQLLDRFYALTGLDDEGQPVPRWRAAIIRRALGQVFEVELPESLRRSDEDVGLVFTPVETVGELLRELATSRPDLREALADGTVAVAVGGTVIVHGRDEHTIEAGDTIELLPLAGGG